MSCLKIFFRVGVLEKLALGVRASLPRHDMNETVFDFSTQACFIVAQAKQVVGFRYYTAGGSSLLGTLT